MLPILSNNWASLSFHSCSIILCFRFSPWKLSSLLENTIMIWVLQEISRSDLQWSSHCSVFWFSFPLSELNEFILEQTAEWFYFCRSTYWNVGPFLWQQGVTVLDPVKILALISWIKEWMIDTNSQMCY